METVEEEVEFRRLWQKRKDKMRGVIALAGLPTNRKTYTAELIGRWAKCPVLCIQHFLSDDIDVEEEDKEEKKKKREEQVLQRGFATLCRVAKFHLSGRIDNPTVIVKSRLDSRFELERLIELATHTGLPLLIIECRLENKFEWRRYFDSLVESYGEKERYDLDKRCMDWYWHTSWKEMEDLIEAGRARQAEWDLHLQQLQLKASQQHDLIVRRLVVDVSNEILNCDEDGDLPGEFFDAIEYLLAASKQELDNNFQSPYEFRQLRPYLLEKRWSVTESKGRSNNPCLMGDCVFKYEDSSIHDHCDYVCGVCEELVTSGTPAYTCRLCILTMHKSCAERIDFKDLTDLDFLSYITFDSHEEHACKSCIDKGKRFSRRCGSCVFQKHLKCGPLPTIIYHYSHQHRLSIKPAKRRYICTTCGEIGDYLSLQEMCSTMSLMVCHLSSTIAQA